MRYWYKKNKLQQLRGFCAVIEEGSVLKAAKKLNIAQSSVSLQISSLERDLKIKLFKRDKKKMSPNPEAFRLYKICKKQLLEIDMIFENVSKTIKYDYDNIIKIAGYSYMLSHILPKYYKKMIEFNKNVRFEIWNCKYEEAIDMLNNGIIDIAVYPIDTNICFNNIEAHKFYEYKLAIGMHKNHPLAKIKKEDLTWEVLAKHDFVTLGSGISIRGFKNIVDEYQINSKFILHNGTWETAMGLVKEGLSISCGDIEYAKWHSDIAIKMLPSDSIIKYQFYILTNKVSQTSKASVDFLKILKSE